MTRARRAMGLRLVTSDIAQHRTPSLTNEADVRHAYDAHVGELYRFALRATGDPGSSQDIVQETFLRAWRSAGKFDPALASLRVWLFAIARNVITDHHRAVSVRPRLRALADQPADSGSSVVDHAEHVVDEWVINEALGRIGPEQRHALTETYLRDRPYGEVAAEAGIPVGTLRSRVFYGLKALRTALDEMGVTL